MFAGKTSELLRQIRRYHVACKRCLIIRHESDLRYSSDSVVTHDKQAMKAVSTTELLTLSELVSNYDVVGIDEGQFFSDLVPAVKHFIDLGKIVVISALDGDYKREPFGHVLELVPLADNVTKLKAICGLCYVNEAPFTKRITEETSQTCVGGADKYVAVCRSCFYKK